MARLPVLDNLHIATPCHASWERMEGSERARHCAECDLTVFNLSEMSREEATNFMTEATGRVCVRLFRRRDGTVLTRDCQGGSLKTRVVRAARSALMAGGLAAGGLGAALAAGCAPAAAGETRTEQSTTCERPASSVVERVEETELIEMLGEAMVEMGDVEWTPPTPTVQSPKKK